MTVPSDLRPLMSVKERSELLQATLVPDAASATIPTASFSPALWKIQSDGSTSTAELIAAITGTAASATPWAIYRGKDLVLVTKRIRLNVGDVVAAAGVGNWSGCITMRFRRVVAE